ncbi:MAG: HrpE/YscL family type III secretion apparatus protein [Puniceicoccales bacterium]|jgi:type III secretion system HrpE/YscL family protein|nr:HrpE/YscL family type III secretion apparatus protein [Puniceicoccales bacterium]
MLEIKASRFCIVPDQKVLPLSEFATMVSIQKALEHAYAESQRVVAEANAEAQRVLHEVNRMSEQLLQKAKENCEEMGKKAAQRFKEEESRGHAEGLANAKKEVAQKLVELARKQEEDWAQLEQGMGQVAVRALERILGEMDEGEVIVKVVKNALKAVRGQKQATLKVAASEAGAVRERLDEILRVNGEVKYLDIIADSQLPSGTCLLETEYGVIDASLKIQLEAIKEAMEKKIVE